MASRHLELAAEMDIAALTAMRPFAVLAPHPDDETLGCGGLIAQGVRAGLDPMVIVLTDGSRSHDAPGWPRQRLAAQRSAESAAAAAALGLPAARLHMLAASDGALEPNRSLMGRVAALLGESRVHTLFVTDPADSHADHAAAYKLAVRLVQGGHASALAVYPVSQRLSRCDLSRYQRLSIAGERAAKQHAIAKFQSQIGTLLPPGTGFRLGAQAIAEFQQPFELFRPVHGLDCHRPALPGGTSRSPASATHPWQECVASPDTDAIMSAIGANCLGGRIWHAGSPDAELAERLLSIAASLVITGVSSMAFTRLRAMLDCRAEVMVSPLPAPDGPFDIIVKDEGQSGPGLDALMQDAALCRTRLVPGGLLLAVHRDGKGAGVGLSCAEAADAFVACTMPDLRHRHRTLGSSYWLDLFEKPLC